MKQPFRILIMGLPGSGKTFLARELVRALKDHGKTVTHLNADEIRAQFNDWDFTEAGRLRQAQRIRDAADLAVTDIVVADFVAPLPKQREIFAADFLVYMDTLVSSRFPDTDSVFQPPVRCDRVIPNQNAKHWAQQLIKDIFNK
jgi:adenylylsulfate kinase